jgi:hypothetical protein
MKSFLVLILLIGACPNLLSQSKKPQRQMSLSWLTDPSNKVFHQRDIHIEDFLFDAARKGDIHFYEFNSFNKEALSRGWPEIKNKMEALYLKKFPVWADTASYHPWYIYSQTEYSPASIVSWKNVLYEARKENKNIPPPDEESWKLAQTDYSLAVIGLDYVIVPPTDTLLQFVHFFTQSLEYVCSFKASEAIGILNKKNHAYYELHFANHIARDLFLFDSDDGYTTLQDLWPLLDTTKLDIKRKELKPNGLHTPVAIRDNKVASFTIRTESDSYGSIPISKLQKFIGSDKSEFYLLGDALAKVKLMKSFGLFKGEALKPFKKHERTIIEKVNKVGYSEMDVLTLKEQPEDNAFTEKLFQWLHAIYQGVSESKIKVYKSDSLTAFYSTKEIIEQWSANYSEWDSLTYYGMDDMVSYNKVMYVSRSQSNVNFTPGQYPAKWLVDKVTIIQPEEIGSLTFKYDMAFSAQGQFQSKTPVYLQLFAKSGFLSYQQIKDFTYKQQPSLWKEVTDWINKNAIVSVHPSPLMVIK